MHEARDVFAKRPDARWPGWRERAASVLSLLLLAACSEPTPESTRGPSAAPSSRTAWVTVRPARDATLASTFGRVHGVGAAAGTAITAPFAGRVLRVHVAPGDAVEEGDALIEVLAPELALAAAERSGASDEGAVVGARLDTLRALAAEGLARADQLHETARDAAAIRTRAATAEARLRAAGLSARDRASLARTGSLVLRAPRAGRVLRLEVREGDPVPSDAPLIVLASEGAVRIEARFTGSIPADARPILRTDRGVVPLRAVGAPLADPETGLRVLFFEPEATFDSTSANPSSTNPSSTNPSSTNPSSTNPSSTNPSSTNPSSTSPTRGDSARAPVLLEGERWPLELVGTFDDAFEVPSSALHALAGDPRRAEVVRRTDAGAQERVLVRVLRVDGAGALVRGALRPDDEVAVEPSRVLGEGEAE
ncbi:MAG: efflux RND transporter periplasmic adaptor subunit [Myxococcota bacterium]|jgi:biotin carboxyl carrier protein|nr:efflux RND transporter periplasmic adaptor subunit [Myxococcota bacterium]